MVPLPRVVGRFALMHCTAKWIDAMSFELLMGTFGVGIAAMLALMGLRQWNMGYRIAGGLSLMVSAAIIIAGVWLLFIYL